MLHLAAGCVPSARRKHARETADMLLFLLNNAIDRLLIGAPDNISQPTIELDGLLLKAQSHL